MPLSGPTLGPDAALLQMLFPADVVPSAQDALCLLHPTCPRVCSRTCHLLVVPPPALSLLSAQHPTVCKTVFTLIAFRVP